MSDDIDRSERAEEALRVPLAELVAHVKATALERYRFGWDAIYECWSDDEVMQELREAGAATKEDAVEVMATFASLYQQRKDDVMCQSGEHEKCTKCGAWFPIGQRCDCEVQAP